MSDPIRDLQHFTDQGDPVHPLPATEVRRRGDRLRRRRSALTSMAAVAAVAVIAGSGFWLGQGDPESAPGPAGDPSSDSSPSRTTADPAWTLTRANLLRDGDTSHDGSGSWTGLDTFGGDGQSTANPCQQKRFAGLGAETIFQRNWMLEAESLNQVVAEFPTTDQAEAAYQEVSDWLADCSPPFSDGYRAEDLPAVTVPVDGESAVVESSWRVDGEEGGEAYRDHRMFTGLVVTGDRLTMLTHLLPQSDDGWGGGDSPVEQMLPTAAERLVSRGGSAPDASPDTDGATGDGSDPDGTAIPDAFPLADGWPGEDLVEPGSPGLSGPNRTLAPIELSACGETVPDLGHRDRLVATWENPEDVRTRELMTFASAQEAGTYLAHLRVLYADCPREQGGDGYTSVRSVQPTTAGEESVALVTAQQFQGAPAPGLRIVHAVRVGSAVLLDATATEGGASGDVAAEVDQQLGEMTDATGTVVSAMCTFSEAGCG